MRTRNSDSLTAMVPVAAITIVIDQASKAAAGHLRGVPLTYPLRNKGVSLQLVTTAPAIEIALMALALIAATVYATPRLQSGAWHPASVGLLLGGAASNLLDRAVLGSVRDFLRVGPIVINFADLAILAAVLLTLTHKPAGRIRTGTR